MKKEKPYFSLSFLIIDFVLLNLSLFLIYYVKRATLSLSPEYGVLLVVFYLIWLITASITRKFYIRSYKSYFDGVVRLFKSVIIAFGILSFLIFVFKLFYYSRVIVSGSLLLFFILETLVYSIYYTFAKSAIIEEKNHKVTEARGYGGEELYEELAPTPEEYPFQRVTDSIKLKLKEKYLKDYPELYEFINNSIDLENISERKSQILSTTTLFNIENLDDNSLNFFINLHNVNDIRRLNKFFIKINEKLSHNAIFVSCGETIKERRRRIFSKYPVPFVYFYYILDFVYKRIFPKLPIIKKIYFVISRGYNRVFSKCEILGRLYFCGFELIDMKEINSKLYFIMKKVKQPSQDKNPSYHLIYKKKAIGENGEIIYPYKFRTMHPYAEYLRTYVTEKYGYSKSGDGIAKIENDFRVTSWGRFFRKHWFDELPQLINVLKGEMKLVGTRPLSERFLAEYPDELKQERLRHKPGCIPPYVAHIHHSLGEYIESDKKYLDYKRQHPVWADIKYFFWAVFNIISGKIRSN